MNYINLPLVLVVLSGLTGIIWLLDTLFFKKKRGSKKEPIIVDYARSFFPVIFIVLILRSFLYEPFRIPSGSMTPTLLTGDFILVNKYIYGIRLPVLWDTKVVAINEPKRGDVAVFKYPKDTKLDFIKRVVGIPGDILFYDQNKILYLNGKVVSQKSIELFNGQGSSAQFNQNMIKTESLPDNAEHNILTDATRPAYRQGLQYLNEPYKIPKGYYFMMGDNRDNSHDSRYWGSVPEDHLVGRAAAVWMHWDFEREGFPIDWKRIGNAIH